MNRELKETQDFTNTPLMAPDIFGSSPAVSARVENTKTDVDILLLSFVMSVEYTKEFYRLLGLGSSFSGFVFSTAGKLPVKFIFTKRSRDSKFVELSGDDGKEYVMFENSLQSNAKLQMLEKGTQKITTFIYTLDAK